MYRRRTCISHTHSIHQLACFCATFAKPFSRRSVGLHVTLYLFSCTALMLSHTHPIAYFALPASEGGHTGWLQKREWEDRSRVLRQERAGVCGCSNDSLLLYRRREGLRGSMGSTRVSSAGPGTPVQWVETGRCRCLSSLPPAGDLIGGCRPKIPLHPHSVIQDRKRIWTSFINGGCWGRTSFAGWERREGSLVLYDPVGWDCL